ncbi:hypothetical protein ACLEE4_02780 [Lonsdalea quercina]|uniref:hypothetical protein n=1 Tax=Lonsdalea quercina TaxID=71657 RepID=UPI0039769DB8
MAVTTPATIATEIKRQRYSAPQLWLAGDSNADVTRSQLRTQFIALLARLFR